MVTRIIQVFVAETNELVHEVKHIHFLVWEDFEVPSDEDMAALMECLQEQADMLIE